MTSGSNSNDISHIKEKYEKGVDTEMKNDLNFITNQKSSVETIEEHEQRRKLAINEGQFLFNQKLNKIKQDVSNMTLNEFSKQKQNLPLARIKRIMKVDTNVRMICSETSAIFSKACELFIVELACRAYIIAQKNKRRTIQKADIKKIIHSTEYFDFMLDVVEESYRKLINQYAEEFFAANIDHEKKIRKMNFLGFKKYNDVSPPNLTHLILDDSSSGGLIQMYLDHYKRFESKQFKK